MIVDSEDSAVQHNIVRSRPYPQWMDCSVANTGDGQVPGQVGIAICSQFRPDTLQNSSLWAGEGSVHNRAVRPS